jgi:AbrB family looped-hinge helix DNA binding protein
MSQFLETSVIQGRGVITLPARVREKLRIDKGATVAFIENEQGHIEIRAFEAEVMLALDEIGDALKKKGMTLDKWLTVSRKNRKRLFKELYPDLA